MEVRFNVLIYYKRVADKKFELRDRLHLEICLLLQFTVPHSIKIRLFSRKLSNRIGELFSIYNRGFDFFPTIFCR